MANIPDNLLNKQCVPLQSNFGKYIKRHNLRHSSSKVQQEIETNKTNFSQMSKYTFLKDYMLNNNYTIEDFTTVKDPSMRGFFYETLWDICFKCNMVENFDNLIHYKGKIEDLRHAKASLTNKIKQTKDQQTLQKYEDKLNRLENFDDISFFQTQKVSLKPISDLQSYLIESKVQSGNTAGISDITMRQPNTTTTSKGEFIFVSSKYYIDEKSINKFDIAAIIHSVKGLKLKYKIVLVVNDKLALMKNIARSHKKHVVDSIFQILDTKDLERAISKLKKTFSLLNLSSTSLAHIFDKQFASFFTMPFKPMLYDDFATRFILEQYKQSGTKVKTLNCFDPSIIFKAICLLAKHLPSTTLVVYTNNRVKRLTFKRLLASYYDLNNLKIVFSSDNQVNSKTGSLHIFLDNDIEYSRTDHVLLIQNGFNTPDALNWTVQDMLACKSGQKDVISIHFANDMSALTSTISSLFNDYESNFLDNSSILQALKTSQNMYPKVQIYTNDIDSASKSFDKYKKYFSQTTTTTTEPTSFVELLFGQVEIAHEDFVYANRIKSNSRQMTKTVILIPNDQDVIKLFQKSLSKNAFTSKHRKLYSNTQIWASSYNEPIIWVTTHETEKSYKDFDTIVFYDNSLNAKDVYDAISTGMASSNIRTLNVVDHNYKRMKNLQSKVPALKINYALP